MTIEKLDLSLEELRPFVLRTLKSKPETQFSNVSHFLAKNLINENIVANPGPGQDVLDQQDKEKINEILWHLIFERVLTVDSQGYPWIRLTDYGKKVVDSIEPTPHDTSGYLKRIKDETPNIDNVILIYLEECLKTYNLGALLSSTITLGCASEKIVLLLANSYVNFLENPQKKKNLSKIIEKNKIRQIFKELDKQLQAIKSVLPSGDLKEVIEDDLSGIFNMFRKNRNDAGHPTGFFPKKEVLFSSIQLFPYYCKKLYNLINYFDENFEDTPNKTP